jgi:hypothetical protein
MENRIGGIIDCVVAEVSDGLYRSALLKRQQEVCHA